MAFKLPPILFLLFIGIALSSIPSCRRPPERVASFVEDSFADFADGRLDASGQNIYVEREGTVRTIHRFDLNSDGYIDLLFNSTHDDYTAVPATLALATAGRGFRVKKLAVEGSLQAVTEDLNRDGYPDLVFCPSPRNVQRQRRFVTIIWGGADGWPSFRSNGILPVESALGVTVADLNRDGWADIVTLNGTAWLPGQPPGNIVRIYWGSERGFLLTRYQDAGVEKGTALAAADMDGDGAKDVAVLGAAGRLTVMWATPAVRPDGPLVKTEFPLALADGGCLTATDLEGDRFAELIAGSEKGGILIIRGMPQRKWSGDFLVPGVPATHIAAGDLDSDGSIDLAVSCFSLVRAGGGEMAGGARQSEPCVRVLWGDHGRFLPERSTRLDAPFSIASAIADIDGDRNMDLAVAVHQGEKTYACESPVFFGLGNRRFEKGKGVATEGAHDVIAVPAEKNRPAAFLFSNSRGGSLREEVPIMIYWGGADGFAPDRRLLIPFRSGYEGTAADLDADGYVDLIAMDEMHGGQSAEADPFYGANIFRGAKSGFDPQNGRKVLHEENAGTSNVADLNRDGYLDIVIGEFEHASARPTELVIYYGSKGGFSLQNRQAIACEGRSLGSLIADFNRDGWLDIAVASMLADRVRIFWGSRGGFSADRQSSIDVPAAIDLETADLNGDGWLDLVACSYADRVNNHNDAGIQIFWGSAGGFLYWNSQRLPGFSPLAPVVADFDGDHFLDLFVPCYHDDLRRELIPSYLYWGSPSGFAPGNRTALVNDSAADGIAADFDRDRRLDLAVANHSRDGDHHALSKVFYNDGHRFRKPRIVELPTHGPHWMWNEDIGHIYDRTYRQWYESSVLKWEENAKSGEWKAKADVPPGTRLRFEIRSAPASASKSLSSQPWRPVEKNRFRLDPLDRCLQYRAVFISDNGDRFPVLDRVILSLFRR